MTEAMMTVRWPRKAPTIAEIQQSFGLADDEISKAFGVGEVDPAEHIYTFLVKENAAAKFKSGTDLKVEGPFSNPRIEPFGPTEGSQ